jgi:pimeloyl-ACP methyl ester carboxylesterase
MVIPLVAAFVPDSFLGAAVKGIFAPDAAPEGYLDYVGAGLSVRVQALRTNSDQINALRPQIVAQSARYGELTLPVELVHGDADTIVPLRIHSDPLAKILPNVHLTVLPGTGHMPHHAHAQAVVDAIARAAARAALP